jgi:hypothetical protein
MVEVFKTNVMIKGKAQRLIDEIAHAYPSYKINFDLEDCDKILRVENPDGFVEPLSVINIVNDSGFIAEVLPDEPFSLQFLLSQQSMKED